MDPKQLREDLQHGQSDDLRRRRAIIGLSLIGMAAMGITSLLQTGLVKHLPDPPIEGFHSDQVNLSDTAYQFGTPDGTLGVASFAANLPIAAFGGEDRAERQPWVPVAAAGKAAVDAVVSGWYFYQMPAKEKAWCPYCIAAALASFGILALTLPEARNAAAALSGPAVKGESLPGNQPRQDTGRPAPAPETGVRSSELTEAGAAP